MPTYVAVFALVLAYVALVAAYLAMRTLAKLRRETSLLARGLGIEHLDPTEPADGTLGAESIVEFAGRCAERSELAAERAEALADDVVGLRARLDAIGAARSGDAERNGALRNTALVRYDAFGDVTGRMSFSLALLDELGHGVTISAIAGRSDTRVYAKGVTGGKGEQELSPEERQAVAAALSSRRGLLHRKSA